MFDLFIYFFIFLILNYYHSLCRHTVIWHIIISLTHSTVCPFVKINPNQWRFFAVGRRGGSKPFLLLRLIRGRARRTGNLFRTVQTNVARSRPNFRHHIVVVDYIVHSTCMNSYVRDDAFYVPLSYYSPSTLEFSNRMFFAPIISYIISTSSFIFFWRKYSSFCLYDFQFFSFFGTISRAVLIKFCFIHILTNLHVSSEYNVSVFIIFFFSRESKTFNLEM